jgi:uncharacterized protein YqeY
MSIKDQITADLKDAMRARDQLRLDTLRSVVSAFNYRRIEAGSDLSDADQLAVVERLVKQRSDSIESFRSGNRPELADKESRERDILLQYLPAQKSPEEIRAVRERLDLSQAEFGQLTGIGVATLSRWERGRMIQNRAMDCYLRLLAAVPDAVRVLERLGAPRDNGSPWRRLEVTPELLARERRFLSHGEHRQPPQDEAAKEEAGAPAAEEPSPGSV